MVKKLLPGLLATLIFWALWAVIAALSNSVLFPNPWQTVRAFWDIVSGSRNWYHIGVTFYRVIAGTLVEVGKGNEPAEWVGKALGRAWRRYVRAWILYGWRAAVAAAFLAGLLLGLVAGYAAR